MRTLLSISPGVVLSGATGEVTPAIASSLITLLIEVFKWLVDRYESKKKEKTVKKS